MASSDDTCCAAYCTIRLPKASRRPRIVHDMCDTGNKYDPLYVGECVHRESHHIASSAFCWDREYATRLRNNGRYVDDSVRRGPPIGEQPMSPLTFPIAKLAATGAAHSPSRSLASPHTLLVPGSAALLKYLIRTYRGWSPSSLLNL